MTGKREDGCDTCPNYQPPHGSTGAGWCIARGLLLYLSVRGAWKYVRSVGEGEKHGWVGTCEQYGIPTKNPK